MLWCLAHCSYAKGWDCKEPDRVIVVASSIASELAKAREENTFAAASQRLDDLQKAAPPNRRFAIYKERIGLALKFNQTDRVIEAYRSLFDLTDASTPVRELARDDLSVLYLDQGKAEEIVALYSDKARPACNVSLSARYALAMAHNALGQYEAAERIVTETSRLGVRFGDKSAKLPVAWQLLQLRLDCNQERWEHCAADYGGLLRLNGRDAVLTRQLTVLLPKMRTFPQLATMLAYAEADGIIKDNAVVPLTAENSVGAEEEASIWQSDIVPASRAPPQYPRDAFQRHQSGYVVLHVEINEDGTVDKVKVVESSPKGVFEAAALQAVFKWRFKPRMANGKTVRQAGLQRIDFFDNP